MKPLTVTAHLSSAPVPGGMLLLDGILMFAVGARMFVDNGGWVDREMVEPLWEALPLAKVRTEYGTWLAASQAQPVGREERVWTNRRPALSEAIRWTDRKAINIASGPDKAMRIARPRRWEWSAVTWTCVGDEAALVELLSYIPALGRLTTHGHGWISRWEISDGGPPLKDYARDVTLRHLPAALVGEEDRVRLRRWLRRTRLPVRPPYYAKENAQDVIQHWTDDES